MCISSRWLRVHESKINLRTEIAAKECLKWMKQLREIISLLYYTENVTLKHRRVAL